MINPLPVSQQDYCPICARRRHETQGNNEHPKCPKKRCAGSHSPTRGPLICCDKAPQRLREGMTCPDHGEKITRL